MGKRFEKKYVVATMKHPLTKVFRVPCDAAGLYFIPRNTTTNGPKYVELLKEKPKLRMYVHGFTILVQYDTPCQWSKVVPEEKQCICAGMAREQPIYQSHQEPVNFWSVMNYKQLSSTENLRQATK